MAFYVLRLVRCEPAWRGRGVLVLAAAAAAVTGAAAAGAAAVEAAAAAAVAAAMVRATSWKGRICTVMFFPLGFSSTFPL